MWDTFEVENSTSFISKKDGRMRKSPFDFHVYDSMLEFRDKYAKVSFRVRVWVWVWVWVWVGVRVRVRVRVGLG